MSLCPASSRVIRRKPIPRRGGMLGSSVIIGALPLVGIFVGTLRLEALLCLANRSGGRGGMPCLSIRLEKVRIGG